MLQRMFLRARGPIFVACFCIFHIYLPLVSLSTAFAFDLLLVILELISGSHQLGECTCLPQTALAQISLNSGCFRTQCVHSTANTETAHILEEIGCTQFLYVVSYEVTMYERVKCEDAHLILAAAHSRTGWRAGQTPLLFACQPAIPSKIPLTLQRVLYVGISGLAEWLYVRGGGSK